jgi:hypothetical protein
MLGISQGMMIVARSDDAELLPRPACGERVGVRGTLHTLGLAESPPHPDGIFDAIRHLPQAGRGDLVLTGYIGNTIDRGHR